MLKCAQDLHGDSSLPTTVFSFGGLFTMTRGRGGDGADGRDAESGLKVGCLEEPSLCVSKDYS